MSRLFKTTLFLLMISQVMVGQKLVNSPYSRFGPGMLEPQGLFKTRSMGGVANAFRDPTSLNYLNPASYSSLDTNSFAFDFGIDYQSLTLKDNIGDYVSDDMNFHHVAMGFPLGKKAGLAFGLVPYSSGYYNIYSNVSEGDPDYDPIIGETQDTHKGTGGYSKFFIGTGVSLFKNFSIGANFEVLFGTIDRKDTYYFLDGNNYYNNLKDETSMIMGYNFTLGAQYYVDFGKDKFASLGFSFTPERKYKSEYENITTLNSVFSGTYYSTDTLLYSKTTSSDLTLPQSYSLGIALGIKDKLTLAADYSATAWSDSNIPGYESYLVNSNSFNAGIEFIPDKYANTNYLNRVEYRAGGHISNTQLMLNNEQIKDFGITFGVGLPMNRTKSKINMFFEYGQRKGSLDNGLHSETYYNFGLSFNFYDNMWFLKRKYN